MLHSIRGQLIKEWKQAGVEGDPGNMARSVGFRLFNLALDYEVIHLEQPYNLVLNGYTIKGKYALLRKRKGAKLPHILVIHPNAPYLKHETSIPPLPLAISRYTHLVTTTKHTTANVLHFPIFRGKHWVDKGLNLSLVKRYLEDMLKVISLNPKYHTAGKHCEDCMTKQCLEIYGQDDHNR